LINKVVEEFRVHSGRLTILYLEENGKALKYRYLFTKDAWEREEWVRLDHRVEEPSHVHMRRKTSLVPYDTGRIVRIVGVLADLSEESVRACGGVGSG